ncbi:hypothetical protein CMQ_390 [Grosmannia clavigera kw1407]|uniref:ubiquitinyl hydrolase 1 n=1 Tax=Grosmannia clavigera (strain kw1407 / UAMH 11150) TaxID=655863 RepID=F0XE27_GROCL|nr:uncharacterized protein CMQ_390 [Grosmannia clavigera kw1407]EFX03462.1 hypothetical protein CMQ_390 [Grosmannia clavigera kw1407]
MSALSSDSVRFIVQQLFLPPQLPQQKDQKADLDTALLRLVTEALERFQKNVPVEEQKAVSLAAASVSLLTASRDSSGSVNEESFLQAFGDLSQASATLPGPVLPLHIEAQNAGLLITRSSDGILFEAFELAPTNKAVMSTSGRLNRSFPGPTVTVEASHFTSQVQDLLTKTLSRMSGEAAPGMTPITVKAKKRLNEIRDTMDPGLVTELLFGFLQPMACSKDTSVVRIVKHTREEVLWDRALLPWRRSPLWLLVRVVVQLVFSRLRGPNSGRNLYKLFMVRLLAEVLDRCLQLGNGIEPDTLHFMSAKITRRLLKLGVSSDSPGIVHVIDVLERTKDALDVRWAAASRQCKKDAHLSPLASVAFRESRSLSLPALDNFLSDILLKEASNSGARFQPAHSLQAFPEYSFPSGPLSEPPQNLVYNLCGLEQWVEHNLQEWMKVNISNRATCPLVYELMQLYHNSASPTYIEDPEASSSMLLTVLELWVACDRSAVQRLPLLAEYIPDIPLQKLQTLVLPCLRDLERLRRIEEYVKRRQQSASDRSVLADFGTAGSFAVRYFKHSMKHQELLQQIEAAALRDRQRKLAELAEMKSRYQNLMKLHSEMVCTTEEFYGRYGWYDHHSRDCEKCYTEETARGMSISVHEWPLPTQSNEKKAVVFELDAPAEFCAWRDATVYLLLDVLGSDYADADPPNTQYSLPSYAALKPYYRSPSRRLELSSTAKPNVVAHYRTVSISTATKDQVCLNNGLRFQAFDTGKNCFVVDIFHSDVVLDMCTYQLPPDSSSLQPFLRRSFADDGQADAKPNMVIASQFECPTHMTLAEYRSLAGLTVGYRLPWQNLLVQLASPSVDFKKIETGLFVLQAIYQAGPPEAYVRRASHHILIDDIFAEKLLATIGQAAARIQKNWDSLQALSTLIDTTARVLRLTPSIPIADKCLVMLEQLRVIAIDWTDDLENRYNEAKDEDQRQAFLCKIVQIATICVCTFDVDDTHLQEVLSVPEKAAILIRCNMLVYDNSTQIGTKAHDRLMRRRCQHLCYRAYPILRQLILNGLDGKPFPSLDTVIQAAWPNYHRGDSGWQALQGEFDQWIVTDIKDLAVVHYNLLKGRLLVNGRPLDRLPLEYTQHESYVALFGPIVFRILPSIVPGMQFSSRDSYLEHKLNFGMGSTDPDMLLQAKKNEQVYHLVPKRVFQGVLPTSLVRDFVHWYDAENETVEFRKRRHMWSTETKPSSWRLKRVRKESIFWWLSNKQGQSLVCPSSGAGRSLSAVFAPLQEPLDMLLILRSDKTTLDIELPRLQLSFHLAEGTSVVNSRQCRGFQVDKDQNVGTLVGLKSKLVLQNRITAERRVIVPTGCISYERKGDHTTVSIFPETAPAYIFKRNDDMQRLDGSGSLQSSLLLCYLHALTSFCLPDVFTGCTGTEQALNILRSAAVASNQFLTKADVDLLRRISGLTPKRVFYPDHLQVMQTVSWDPHLPMLAQHPHFFQAVQTLLKENKTAEIYYPDSDKQPARFESGDVQLWTRDASRTSTVRITGYGAEDRLSALHDIEYVSRDLGQASQRAERATKISSIMFERTPYLRIRPLGRERLSSLLLKIFKEKGTVLGSDFPTDGKTNNSCLLDYAGKWMLNHDGHWAELWCWLHRQAKGRKLCPSQLNLWLATMAFSAKDMEVIQAAACLFLLPEVTAINPPPVGMFQLRHGDTPDKTELTQLLSNAELWKPQDSCPENNLPRYSGESNRDYGRRRECAWESSKNQAISSLVDHLAAQKAQPVPLPPTGVTKEKICTYIKLQDAINAVRVKFTLWHQNWLFKCYLDEIADAISRTSVQLLQLPKITTSRPLPASTIQMATIQLADVLEKATVPESKELPHAGIPKLTVNEALPLYSLHLGFQSLTLQQKQPQAEAKKPRLEALVKSLTASAESTYEREYAGELRHSLDKLQDQHQTQHANLDVDGVDHVTSRIRHHLDQATRYLDDLFSTIHAGVYENVRWDKCLALRLGHSPRLSRTLLLQQLARDGWGKLQAAWKPWIVAYGLALTETQRAQRMMRLVRDSDQVKTHIGELLRELQNEGHTNWEAFKQPETLLLEVESGILIRAVQEDITEKMRQPPHDQNAVMQLNMGEGKSSVIVPTVVAALADGARLVRVIVAKPQSRQMLHMLVAKFGGLLNRRVFHLPFSRALRLQEEHAKAIFAQCRRCMETGGVLLVQPEHVLSLQLMGLEAMASGRETLGCSLLKTQHLFNTAGRDVVDESDENFSVRFELIYTMGTQTPIEFCPYRWSVIQNVLEVVRNHVKDVSDQLPLSIEIQPTTTTGHGSFPRVRLLKSDAVELLLRNKVPREICNTGLPGFPIARQAPESRDAVLRYMTEADLQPADIDAVESGHFWTADTRDCLLLLRGLFAGGLLAFSFGQKRWRVNYGLDTSRRPPTKLAVPYRAKDQPAARSEFSHPDVVITLTCLCYYYQGLDDADLYLTFAHLLASGNADDVYQIWVHAANNLPDAFRQVMGVNMEDRIQCETEVFPAFRFTKPTIDYFLDNIVFAKQMKQFPHKLSASGWDLGASKTQRTTGFSGTIDSRKVLPLDMTYLDLPEQKHTNALVLEYLLQPENGVLPLQPPLPQDADAPTSSVAETLLKLVVGQSNDRLRVILDVGAQILELSNRQVASLWLKMMRERHAHVEAAVETAVEAAVYFDDREELMVLDKRGRAEPLRISPYADQLDLCIVFLDEAHTRGTDLRLPSSYRAAVTLGARLTKDRLVQACMRMRKLGHGQSVVFVVPQDVQTQIQECRTHEEQQRDISVLEVLSWAIGETHNDLRKSMPLWAVQGRRFEKQLALWEKARAAGEEDDMIVMTHDLASEFLEDEAKTLEERYRPMPEGQTDSTTNMRGDRTNMRLRQIDDRCAEVSRLNFSETTLHEEQERELSPEIEEQRQIERPPPATPATHSVHQDIRTFAATGRLAASSSAVLPAFQVLRATNASALLDVDMFPQDVLVTADFASTIVPEHFANKDQQLDSFQRPPQWILSSQPVSWDRVVIISPYEAQELLPTVRKSHNTSLHLYAPRPNLEVSPLDGLDLYTTSAARPPSPERLPLPLALLLNLFSGQLYFKSFAEYTAMCDMLRLSWQEASDTLTIEPDGYIHHADNADDIPGSEFTQSPVPFLKAYCSKIRRDGHSIDRTHLGKMLSGVLLRELELDGESVKGAYRAPNLGATSI